MTDPRAVWCPFCRARPGDPCRYLNGNPMFDDKDCVVLRFHVARKREANAAGQQRDDEVVEADALPCRLTRELGMEGGRHSDVEGSAVGLTHGTADSTMRSMTRRPFTPSRYQIAVLDTLEDTGSRHVSGMGGHPASLTRALREMEQRGLVGRNLHDKWYIRPAGSEMLALNRKEPEDG